eukprot:3938558-Rhodomonas_salina.2
MKSANSIPKCQRLVCSAQPEFAKSMTTCDMVGFSLEPADGIARTHIPSAACRMSTETMMPGPGY